MTETHQHHLKIGDSIQIKRGFMTRIGLLYAGMPNERTFSLVITHTRGHQATAYNLYLPTNQRHIDIAETPITIHGISPTTLQITTD